MVPNASIFPERYQESYLYGDFKIYQDDCFSSEDVDIFPELDDSDSFDLSDFESCRIGLDDLQNVWLSNCYLNCSPGCTQHKMDLEEDDDVNFISLVVAPKDIKLPEIPEYTPETDHCYHQVPEIIAQEKVESAEDPKEENVDVWKLVDLEDLETPVPVQSRRNLQKHSKKRSLSVSIKTAATVAMKRTKVVPVVPKYKKVLNSLETTPSSSDTEDLCGRPAKYIAIQAISRSNSSLKLQRISKRTDHNTMEKQRRQHQRELYEELRREIPSHHFRGDKDKIRTNPSKQNILLAAQRCVKQLRKDEKYLKKRLKKETDMYRQMNNQMRELSKLVRVKWDS